MMKKSILDRLKELGGNVDSVKNNSFQEDILSITFDTVLYKRPIDTPWASAKEQEPIRGIGEFVDDNIKLFNYNKNEFYQKIINKYYCLTQENWGQIFWEPKLFTPFIEGTDDFDEWNDIMEDDDTDISEIVQLTNNNKPKFIRPFYNETFLRGYYICSSDPNLQNPTLFSTDLEIFFSEVENEGTFEHFLENLMTKEELLEIVKNKLEK